MKRIDQRVSKNLETRRASRKTLIGALCAVAVIVLSMLTDGAAPYAQNAKGKSMNDTSTQASKKQDLVITRIFDAPTELVWKAWTDPAFVMRWWGPRGFTSPSCKIDFREGGKFIFCMRAPKDFQGGQDFYTAGVYKKIVPLKRIEFSQALSDKDGNRIDPTTMGMPPDFPTEIPSALAFKRVGDKTELTVIEYGWTVGQMRDMSESGMNECLDKLAEALARN